MGSGRKRGQNKSDWDWVYDALGFEIAERLIREAHSVPVNELRVLEPNEVPGWRTKYKAKAATA